MLRAGREESVIWKGAFSPFRKVKDSWDHEESLTFNVVRFDEDLELYEVDVRFNHKCVYEDEDGEIREYDPPSNDITYRYEIEAENFNPTHDGILREVIRQGA